jgi:hypothetical protein
MMLTHLNIQYHHIADKTLQNLFAQTIAAYEEDRQILIEYPVNDSNLEQAEQRFLQILTSSTEVKDASLQKLHLSKAIEALQSMCTLQDELIMQQYPAFKDREECCGCKQLPVS